jgi:methylated-DNA-[protein]-cysteine S-methyltransferase
MPDFLKLVIGRMDTPIGEMLLVTDGAGKLRALDWADHEQRMLRLLKLHYGKRGYILAPTYDPQDVHDIMKRYFAGDIHAIDDIEVETAGTPFQRSVWKELRKIPGGSAISYGRLAEEIDRPNAVRAVGLANGSNPIGIVVPCHRVIGANGSLTGYGGGLDRKRWLLDHEQRNASCRAGA